MENLKHSIVAAVAVIMVCSLATAQAASIKSDLSDTAKAVSAENAVSQYVWDDNLAVETKLSGINKNTKKETEKKSDTEKAVPAIEIARQSGETVDTAAKAEFDTGYVILSEGTLNVRESASTEAEIIGRLNCGDKVTISETLDGWYKVSYGDEGKTGYVSSAAITASEEEAKAALLESFMYETGVAVVSEGALNIRNGAGKEYEVIDQLSNGEKVIVLEKGAEWLKVYYGRNYETGYVSAASVNINDMVSRDDVRKAKAESVIKSAKSKGYISISSGAVNVRSSASENGEVISQLYNRDDILIISTNSGWTKIIFGSNNTVGYVKSQYIVDASAPSRSSTSRKTTAKSGSSKSSASSSSNYTESAPAVTASNSSGSALGQALVNQAAKYIGTKYVYGGSSPSGFDCSGLVQYSCRQLGISVGRSSRDQFNNGVPVAKSDLQPGDLVFFARNGTISHVGIYAGNGQMIHSPQTGKTVTYTSINSASRSRSYAGARRVTG